MKMFSNLLKSGLLLLLLQPFSASVAGRDSNGGHGHRPLYKNPHVPVEKRIDDLLGRMTVEDKMAQLIQGLFASIFCFGVYAMRWVSN